MVPSIVAGLINIADRSNTRRCLFPDNVSMIGEHLAILLEYSLIISLVSGTIEIKIK